MEIFHALSDVLEMIGFFGGISLIILAGNKAKIDKMRAEREAWQPSAAAPPQDAVLAELKALKQQVSEMQSTGHQFDLSFDAALSRLDERVNRVETRVVAAEPTSQQTVGRR